MNSPRTKRRKTRARRWTILAVLLAAAGAGAWFFFLRDGEAAPEYRTAEVTRGDIEYSISALGSIQPKEYVDVGAQVSGQLENLTVEAGDQVSQGDLLGEIDAEVLRTQVEASQAQLRELRATRDQRQAELHLARAEAERAEQLFAANAIPRSEFEASASGLAVAQAQLAQLEAQIDRVSSTIQGDLANLNYTKIYAPISGTVVSITALEGQTLNANQTAPIILRIADLSVMTVEADVSEADVTRLEAGMPAYFHTLGAPDRRWESTVRQVLPQPEILNDVVLYKALLDVENENRVLLPDMSAQVYFLLGEADDVLKAPIAAIRDLPGERAGPAGGAQGEGRRGGNWRGQAIAADNGGTSGTSMAELKAAQADHPGSEIKMARVMTPEGPRPRPVLTGLTTRTEVEIIEGLEEGDTLVLGPAIQAPAEEGRRGGRWGG